MAIFILRKLIRAILTLLICVTAVFFVLRLAGDPIASLLPDDSPQDVIDAYRARFGLDLPLWDQYAGYLTSVLRGDLGISFRDQRPVIDVIGERLPATIQLGLAALALSLLVGAPMGVVAALNRNTALDRLVMAAAVLGFAMPIFFLAILLILLFAMQLRVLPSAGADTWWHMILPVVVLAAATAGKVARYMRTAIIDVLGQPYVRAATGKGLKRFAVIARHALPNAAIPLVTFLGFELGTLVGGAVVTETVFAWPGVGRLLVVSVGQRDLAVVQAIVLLVAATMVTASLLADLAQGWLDPRTRGTAAGPAKARPA
jgi:peptide/nickel transport system permease protein